MAQPLDEQAPPAGVECRWRLVEMSGETINIGSLAPWMLPWDTRITARGGHLDMGWLCWALHEAPGVQWPYPWVRFVVGAETFTHVNLRRSTRRLTDLMAAYGEDGLLIITVIRLPPPRDFDNNPGFCTCDFPGVGCCVTGRRDVAHIHERGCRACGINGCCRAGECGHACCGGGDNDSVSE